MCKKLICFASFVVVLSLVGNVQAQPSADATWTDATGDHNWFTPGNWSEFPTLAHWAKIRNGLPGPTIASEGTVAYRVHIGYSEGGALTMDSGTLDISGDDLLMGKSGNTGTLNMNGGTITVARDLEVAGGNPGFLNMTGGTIIVGDDFEIPESEGDGVSIAEVHLDGGSIIIGGDLHMFDQGSLDITAGKLIIDGNAVSAVQGYIDNGWITAYEGNGTLRLDYDVTNPGRTMLKAVHFLNPNPADGSSVPVGVNQLQWTLPEPNQPGGVVTCDVYFGTDPIVENNPKVVTGQTVESLSVTLAPLTTYYWALDLYDSSISDTEPFMLSPIFIFNTMNKVPVVNAGPDVVTWLADGVRTGNLDATVTDDGAIMPYTVQWTVVSEPNVGATVIQTGTAEDTSITLSAVGQYVLKLEAFDGEYTSSDTVTINVYNDSCQAAKSLPNYVPLVGDLNWDCKVDDVDLALLQANWLKDNSLTEDWFTVE
jgi:hypothetical protein